VEKPQLGRILLYPRRILRYYAWAFLSVGAAATVPPIRNYGFIVNLEGSSS